MARSSEARPAPTARAAGSVSTASPGAGPSTATPGDGLQIGSFSVARLPRIVFGAGRSVELAQTVRSFGTRALVIVRPGFCETAEWVRLEAGLLASEVHVRTEVVEGEPSPELVDGIIARARQRAGKEPDVLVGIGGGSVLDTAKAVAGLVIPGNSVMDHLEGVGPQLPYRGPAVPFIAVPTTAGTGSEATKNAVISQRGPTGYKKSFRDDKLVAQVAIVDPDLLTDAPPALIASNGMDAFTQLLESFCSTRSNPFTDALALSGLAAVRDGLLPWYDEAKAGRGADAGSGGDAGPGGSGGSGGTGRPGDRGAGGSVAALARERMAYAALLSGICLAQAGLGAAHGLASPLGAQYPIPHGVACGATLVAATRANIAAMRSREPNSPALARYALVGRLLADSTEEALEPTDDEACDNLIDLLERWRKHLSVPRLKAFGIREASIPALLIDSRGSSMKTNPIVLTDDEIVSILRESL